MKIKFTKLSIIFFSCLCGCSVNLARVTSAQIGCPENEIQISEDSKSTFSGRNWIATCRGKIFYCGAMPTGGKNSSLTCTPELPKHY